MRQFFYIEIDPYANAFNVEDNGKCWTKDETEDTPWDWERKYEIDSLAIQFVYYMIIGRRLVTMPSLPSRLREP